MQKKTLENFSDDPLIGPIQTKRAARPQVRLTALPSSCDLGTLPSWRVACSAFRGRFFRLARIGILPNIAHPLDLDAAPFAMRRAIKSAARAAFWCLQYVSKKCAELCARNADYIRTGQREFYMVSRQPAGIAPNRYGKHFRQGCFLCATKPSASPSALPAA